MGLRRKKVQFQPGRIYLGAIVKPHSLKGEVKFKPFGCDAFLLEEFETVHVDQNDRTLDVEYVRGSEKNPIVKFKTIDTRDDSEALKGFVLWIEEEKLPELEDDYYYESDFLYSRAQTVTGADLGRIEQIIETGECDVLVIRNSQGEERLLPANRQNVKEVRKKEALIIVDLPDGI